MCGHRSAVGCIGSMVENKEAIMKKYLAWIIFGLLLVSILAFFPSSTIASLAYQDDPKVEADRLRNVGDDLLQSGQYQAALNEYEAALVLYQKAGLTLFRSPAYAAPPIQEEDLKAKADALYQEAFDLFSQGDYQGAFDRYQEALG